jgi:mRNA-degrading endonuclease toxin of MazEF toxin-antitoxin module
MDSVWWWLALGAVVLVALVAAVVDSSGRRPRRGGRGAGRARGGGRPAGVRTRPPGRPGAGGPGRGPAAGEVWWARVPYEDGPGAKDRPCLVLAVRGGTARVVKITSRRAEGRPGVIALPRGSVGDVLGRASFLETDELRSVRVSEFRRRVGRVDPRVWERVRHLAR